MIGGQYLDITARRRRPRGLPPAQDRAAVRRAVGLGLWSARFPAAQAPWRAFGEELGVLFQAVDDVLDGDGYATELGADGARASPPTLRARAHDRLEAIEADTSVLGEIVDSLAVRTA